MEFGSERFLAGPNRIQLTHLGQILFQQHVFKAREPVCGIDDGLNWQNSRSNLREAKRVLVLHEKIKVDILVSVDDPFIEIHRLRARRWKILLVQEHNSFFQPFHPIQWILPPRYIQYVSISKKTSDGSVFSAMISYTN